MPETTSLVSVDVWTIIFQWVNLFILYFIFKKVLFGRVADVLEKRKSEVGKLYDEAKSAQTSAENLKQEYEAKLAEATKEAQQIVAQAQTRANRQSEEMLAEAKESVQQLKQRTNEELELERKRVLLQAKSEISDMAVSIAAKVIDREVKAKDHEKLINDFIDNVGEAV